MPSKFRTRALVVIGIWLCAGCYDFASLGSLHPGDAGVGSDGSSDGGGGDAATTPCDPTRLDVDPRHCGSCANDCTRLPGTAPTIRCIGGACDFAVGCVVGRAHCSANPSDGCESDVSVAAHCGSCTQACTPPTPLCNNAGSGFACSAMCLGGTPNQCGQACVNLQTDPKNCGTCGRVCANTGPGLVPICVMGRCDVGCDAAHHLCNAMCASNLDPQTCGVSCSPCVPPQNAVATCDGAACGFQCTSGFVPSGMSCVPGPTWSAEPSGVVANALNGVWGSSASDVYAVGEQGTILHSFGTGTWTSVAAGMTMVNLWSVWGSASNDVFVVGDHGTVLHLAGSTWTVTVVPPIPGGSVVPGLSAVWGLSPQNVFAVGAAGAIYHYDGASWTSQTSAATASSLNGIWGTGNWWTVGNAGTILYSGGDGTWTPEMKTTTMDLFGIRGNLAGHLYAVGGLTSPVIVFSSDNGATWNPMTLPSNPSVGLWAVYLASDAEVFAVGTNATILHSPGDSTWSVENGSMMDQRVLLGVWGSSATDLYAVGQSGTILRRK